MLGIPPGSDVDQVRSAYHALAKKYHPDHFQDAESQQEAHQRMVALNSAYEAAMKLAEARANAPFTAVIATEDAIRLCRKMMAQHSPESALRQLLRADVRTAAWYAEQGYVLATMGQYVSAEQSYTEAIRREPDNNDYRRGRLDAVTAARREKTLGGRLKKLLKIKDRD